MVEKLKASAANGTAVNMEAVFSQLTLDVIGLSLFNYNFDALTTDTPVIDAVYTALKEAEARSTDILPYWKASTCLCNSSFYTIVLDTDRHCSFLFPNRLTPCVKLFRDK